MSSPSSDKPRRQRGGKRVAEKQPRARRLRPRRAEVGATQTVDQVPPEAPREPPSSKPVTPTTTEPTRLSKGLVGVWLTVALAGTVALVAAILELGPPSLDGIGAILVVSALAWLLAARTSGRALVAAGLACLLGVSAVLAGGSILPTGAAVMTCALGGVYAVMVTVPATTFGEAVREVLVATLVSSVTAIAALGFHPTVVTTRFDLVSLVVGVVLCGAMVYRLGAGLHGLGRRGLIAVAVGAVLMIATLAYAEVLRLYGAQETVQAVLGFVDATTELIGAFPRPLVVLLGVPALLWGSVLRSRRRQGWWVSMFGITATVPLAAGLIPPDSTLLEGLLRAVYSLLLGLPIGWLVIRVDRALTGSGGTRGRRAEEAEPLRPEPSRFAEL